MAEVQHDSKVFDQRLSEEIGLEKLGYQQELKRSIGLWGMIGFSFGIVTCWTVLANVLIAGIKSGGPPVMIWSWLGVSICSLAVGYSLAEICSAYPVAGGQYSWVMVLAPPKVARGMSWVTGWFLLIGLLSVGAANNLCGAQLIIGQVQLTHPDFVIQRWHTGLVAYAQCIFCLIINLFFSRHFSTLGRMMGIWNIFSFFVFIITILAKNDHKQSAAFVFKDFYNETGFAPSFAAMVGILQAAYGMLCYDTPAHMTEEMNHASKEAPKAIVASVYLGAFTGFVFLVAICFCIGDIDTTAASLTGVPLIEIVYNSTGSKVGTCILINLIVIIIQACGVAILAESSRTVFAFARDHGLPRSSFWAKVDLKRRIPIRAIFFSAAWQMAFGAIYFGTLTGFLTVIAVSTEGFLVSYAVPIFARLLSHFMGYKVVLDGPYRFKTRTSLALNIVALCYTMLAIIVSNFPTVAPVNSENMNYNSAAVGLIMLISLLTWITTGRKNFTGPKAAVRIAHALESDSPSTKSQMEATTKEIKY